MRAPFSKAIGDALEGVCHPLGMSFSEFLYGSAIIEEVVTGKSIPVDDIYYAPFTELLFKAGKGPHKYIMRIPNKNPPPKYRYVYKIHRKGKYVGDEEHFRQGAKLKVKHRKTTDGEEEDTHAHLEVVESKDGKVKVKHSETGEIEEHDHKSLSERIRGDYTSQITMHKQKLRRDLEAVMKFGTLGMQKRLVERAAQFGVYVKGGFDDSDDKWSPPERAATTLHEKALPKMEMRLPEEVKNFPNPDGPKKQLFKHQAEGVQRILDSWEKRDGFLLQDETGLGKTLSALAAVIARGEKRNLFVVPENGKAALMAQLREDAKLYGVEIKDALGAGPDDEGIFVVSYDDLYTTEVVMDPDTGKPKKFGGETLKKHTLKDEFKSGFGALVFDECQNMANPAGVRAQACIDLQERSGKALYMSATPFTNVRDMHYMRKLGMFSNGKEFVEWAQQLGAKTTKGDAPGDLSAEISNPKTPVPLVAASAFMHHHGMTIRRAPDMNETMSSNFQVVKSAEMSADHKQAFSIAEEIHQVALDAGMSAFTAGGQMAMWRKQQWECAKVGEGIAAAKKALDEGRSVGMFFSFKKFDHAPLRSFADMLRTKKGMKEHGLDPAQAKSAADKIDALVAKMPKFDPIEEATKALGDHIGQDKIAQIHGGAKTDSKEEQQAFQANDKQVMVGTIAKAGTGLSFHDTKSKEDGGRPRTQINMSLPYTATEFQQLNGRMHRLGSRSNTEMMYMLGDHDSEKDIGAIVASKLKSMGAAVAGDVGSIKSASDLANWEFSRKQGTDEQIVDGIAATETGVELKDHESEMSRNHFQNFIDEMEAGGDPFGSSKSAIEAAEGAKEDRKHRSSAAKLQAAGFNVERVGDTWRIRGVRRKDPVGNAVRQAAVDMKNKQRLWQGRDVSPLESVKAGKGVQDVIIRDPMGLSFIANKLAKKGHIPEGDHGMVDGWEQGHLEGHSSRKGAAGRATARKSMHSFTAALRKAVPVDHIDAVIEKISKSW